MRRTSDKSLLYPNLGSVVLLKISESQSARYLQECLQSMPWVSLFVLLGLTRNNEIITFLRSLDAFLNFQRSIANGMSGMSDNAQKLVAEEPEKTHETKLFMKKWGNLLGFKPISNESWGLQPSTLSRRWVIFITIDSKLTKDNLSIN